MPRKAPSKSRHVAARGRVRPHDPFELIRWLAYSQPDPRKALAELVQNSLDAGASRIRIQRVRERGVACLRVWDDGEGVIPSLDRIEALRFIATNIGHSRKRNLSPQERLQLMTQGQYGIGLLGFWSLGERLEMCSSVPSQAPHKLVLHRDDSNYEIEPLRGKLDLDQRFTEIIIVGVHTAAQSALAGRRAADYLAAELRGQLLSRSVDVVYEDRMARGTAQKSIPIRPVRFGGERLAGFDLIPIEDHAPIRLEFYIGSSTEGDDGSRLAVYASGTLVAESFDQLGGLDLDHPPWTDVRLRGFVDFPELTVAPGSRRGIVIDGLAECFAQALRSIEPQVQAALDAIDETRAREIDRSLLRDLRRAFRELLRAKPRYQMPHAPSDARVPGAPAEPIASDSDSTTDAQATPRGVARSERLHEQPEEASSPPPQSSQLSLLPPGPLQQLRIVPQRARLAIHSLRVFRVEVLDVTGRACAGEVSITWVLDGLPGCSLEVEHGDRNATLRVADQLASGLLRATATQAATRIDATAEIEIVESIDRSASLEGIPAPVLIEDRHGAWRSRWSDERWEVNAGHADYLASAGKPMLRLRYLASLFAKEVVLKSSGDPRLERALEQLIEVIAFADRSLSRPAKRERQ